MRTEDTNTTYEHLCTMLDNNKRVYYSRFGDGDFFVMNGHREKMHRHSNELERELTESLVIDNPLYIRGSVINYPHEAGMRNGVFAPYSTNQTMLGWLINNQKIPPSTVFYSSIMFHYISVFKQEKMINFLDKYIRPRTKMFIGSVPKESIERLVGPIDFYVKVPAKDAYYSIDEWWPNVIENIDKVDLCLPTAGMAGRVIQKRLWNLGKDIHSIDLGSVVDAACNISTRTWIGVVAKGEAGSKIENLLI